VLRAMLQADLHSDVPQETIARGSKSADDSMRLPGDECHSELCLLWKSLLDADLKKKVIHRRCFVSELDWTAKRGDDDGTHMSEKVRECESKRAERCHADGLLGAMLAENVMHLRNPAAPESTRSTALYQTRIQTNHSRLLGRNANIVMSQEKNIFIVSY
jgi:hypothetical protein